MLLYQVSVREELWLDAQRAKNAMGRLRAHAIIALVR
jgi:hypothetical protein